MLLALLPTAALAQQAAPVASVAPRAWSGGFGAGNGLELHVGLWESRFIAFGRVRGKWWGPTTGPTADWFSSNLNTRSRQVEAVAAGVFQGLHSERTPAATLCAARVRR